MSSDVALGTEEAALVCATVVLTSVVRAVLSPFFGTTLGQRLLPMLPFFVAVACSVFGLSVEGSVWERIAIGLFAGALAGQGYKVGRTTIAGAGLAASKEVVLPPIGRRQRRRY